jgi:demethylmenaquinone methyltransferase/2-methoxy-6-polyprenyl-1,4-benzoquinol methylase
VLQDARALDHVLAHLRSGASVVAAGLQWAPAWCLPLNLFVLGAALYSVTSLAGLEQPWKLLAERVRKLEVRSRDGGTVFIARGVL